MKNRKTIIVLLILNIIMAAVISNLLINRGIKVEKQIIKEMTQSENEANLQTQIDNLNTVHEEYAKNVQSYKKQIADSITNQGVSTSEDAIASVMVENIGKILQTRTSDATATADNISEGKIAYVNGEKIIGTGVDVQNSFEDGKKQSGENVVLALYKNQSQSYTIIGKSISVSSKNGGGYKENSFNFNSGKINIASTPDGKIAALNNISFTVAKSAKANYPNEGDSANATISYSVYLEDGTCIKSGSTGTINVSLFDYNIGENTYVYVVAKGYVNADSGNNDDTNVGTASASISNITMSYIPIDV